jgi:hypothetical protein
MSDRQHPRNLSPPTGEGAPQWKAVGLELAHRCTFCGGPSEATLAPLSPHLQVRRSDPQCPVNVVSGSSENDSERPPRAIATE